METEVYRPINNVRFVTAAALFDGHDAAINIMRRILQDSGVEVIHLGHNRSVDEVVNAAIQEDADAVGLSILSGAHMTLLPRLLDLLRQKGGGEIVVFAGGIIPEEDIPPLRAAGVSEIFLPGASLDAIVRWVREHVKPHGVKA